MIVAVALLAPLIVLGVEVQLARTGPRLDDETGYRPNRLPVRAGADPLRVVWLGDSTATGVGAGDLEGSMAHRVASRLSDGPVELTALGESGAQVHEVIDHQLPALRATGADVVLISVGANDVTALTRVPTFEARYRRMVRAVQEVRREARIVLVGIPDIGTAPRLLVPLRQLAGARGHRLDRVIADIAEERDVLHVDLARRTSSTFSSDPGRYFSADDYHPSRDGHGVWAEAVLAALGRR